MLDDEGVLKICDYGVSVKVQDENEMMKNQCGTIAYMAPELFTTQAGDAYSGQQADIWSLGVVLYAMACGSVPFKGHSVDELKQRIA